MAQVVMLIIYEQILASDFVWLHVQICIEGMNIIFDIHGNDNFDTFKIQNVISKL